MTDVEDQDASELGELSEAEEQSPEDSFVDILTGEVVKSTQKKLLVQKVLRQLIESYGFDRNDLEVGYRPRIKGQGNKTFDIAIFHPGTEHTNENIQHIVVCQPQKQHDKLRSLTEADSDLEKLRQLLYLA